MADLDQMITIAIIGTALSLLCGCKGGTSLGNSAAPDHAYTAREVFPLALGQHWDMKDGNGKITHFEVIAEPGERACEQGPFLGFHVTKNDSSAFWWPGVGGAWGIWMFKYENGSWNQPVIIGGDTATPLFTYQYDAAPRYSKEPSYYWFPRNMSIKRSDGKIVVDTAYISIDHYGDDLSQCMSTTDNNYLTPKLVKWHTETYVTDVTTPVYSGPAIATYMCEGQNCGTAAETWYFAPGIGVVKIYVNGGDGPSGYMTVRIN